ncbi:hypothetical protein MNBD_PLANCTO03-2449 [hydrothermal vent metagenome]|uniref:PEP-CTERM protein-sorting domain-containing protein n=1 Tax=hydrothermal vent metagenome TaxID=652676 RepID=A0A3B1DHV6_9ZZZZ
MKAWTYIVLAGIASVASAQWYNGDPDNENGLSAEFNTSVSDAYVFEDFDHAGGTITDIWGNYYIDGGVFGYKYEIRSGVSNGFGGTLHASGSTDGSYTVTPNGWDGFGFVAYTVAADIADIDLARGTYMLALSVGGNGSGRAFVQSTSGTNGVGTPNDNDLNWFRSGYFGADYVESYQGLDYSYGVNVPAPASVVLLGLGGLVGSRRRRSSR